MHPDRQDWRTRIADYIRTEAKPVDKYGHQPRLYELARQVGAGSSYDDEVVYAAAWLHDLGVFVGHRPEEPELLAKWDNTMYAMERAPALLMRFGFPAKKISAVAEAIRTHQPHAEPPTIEAVILRDADILEQLGAVGILRAVAKVGRDTRFSTFTPVIAVLEEALDTLPRQLRTGNGRRLAEPRIQVLRQFVVALRDEAGEHLH